MLRLSTYTGLDPKLRKIFDEISFQAVNGRIKPFVVDEQHGKIGINTDNPYRDLDVNGDIGAKTGYFEHLSALGSISTSSVDVTSLLTTARLGVTDTAHINNLYTYGNSVISGSIIIPGLTEGSVLFAGPSGIISQDNAKFFWNNTNDRLAIGRGNILSGSALTVQDNNSGADTWLAINSTASKNAGIRFFDADTEKWIIYKNASNNLIFSDTSGVQPYLAFTTTSILINSGLNNLDTRISGDEDANVLYVVASDGYVGFGTNTPDVDIHIQKDLSGDYVALRVENTSDTEDSTAELQLKVAGADASDVKVTFDVGTGAPIFSTGVDNSDSDKFKISAGSNLGTNDRLVIDSSGNIGIGVSNPTAKLEINGGNVEISTGSLILDDGTNTTDGGLKFDRTNEDLSIGDGSASQIVHMGAWKTYTPTFTGFSADPTVFARYTVVGKLCVVSIATSASGTSNATSFTITLPFNAKTLSGGNFNITIAVITNSGTTSTTPGMIRTQEGSNVATVFRDFVGTAWTNSGGKHADFVLSYEIA